MTDDNLTEAYLQHTINADKRGYSVVNPAGETIHSISEKYTCSALTNVQRGVQWVKNSLGIVDEVAEEEEGGVAVDSNQSVAIV